jgi:hypothetical protein
MPSAKEISEQVARESERRSRLAVPAFAGGLLYLLGGIVATATVSGAPTVGLLQGLSPALKGEANPRESPRVPEIKYISHHAFALIAGSVLVAIAIVILALVVLTLFDATRFRRPETWAPSRPLVIVGGAGLAVLSVAHEVLRAIKTHNFATGHNLTGHAADRALLLAGSESVVTAIVVSLCAVMLAVGIIAVMVGSMRVGLLPRWAAILGIVAGVLLLPLFQSATLQLLSAFWLIAMGILFAGRWPNGDPPAWAAGEARPWPSQAEMRAKRAGAAEPALSTAGADVAPAPSRPAANGSQRKRRRKRGARR